MRARAQVERKVVEPAGARPVPKKGKPKGGPHIRGRAAAGGAQCSGSSWGSCVELRCGAQAVGLTWADRARWTALAWGSAGHTARLGIRGVHVDTSGDRKKAAIVSTGHVRPRDHVKAHVG
eukprot:343078-Prymnesium_polylepis.1